MTLSAYNLLSKEQAAKHLMDCCGSTLWVSQMMAHFPFESEKQLVHLATSVWYEQCTETDWKESFTHHPKIGDVKSLTEKFAGKEQAGVAVATAATIQALAQAIDDSILTTYKLWPTNYVAYDILYKTNTYESFYTENEKKLFEKRLDIKIDQKNPIALEGFLNMYANPVVNKMKYQNAH